MQLAMALPALKAHVIRRDTQLIAVVTIINHANTSLHLFFSWSFLNARVKSSVVTVRSMYDKSSFCSIICFYAAL